MKKIESLAFEIKARGRLARVIRIVPNQITTQEEHQNVNTSDGRVMSDVRRDILKVAVIERHHATGRIAVGLVRGFGIKRGALASSVCHDAHNLITVGTNDLDMAAAVMELSRCGGGFVATCGGKIIEKLPLPIAGLMSNRSASEVSAQYMKVERAARALGASIENPFLALSFMSLSVVPKLRITDRGLIDVSAGRIVPLFI